MTVVTPGCYSDPSRARFTVGPTPRPLSSPSPFPKTVGLGYKLQAISLTDRFALLG